MVEFQKQAQECELELVCQPLSAHLERMSQWICYVMATKTALQGMMKPLLYVKVSHYMYVQILAH